MDAKHQDLTNSIGLLILRVGLGGFMMIHGAGKFQRILDGNWQFADPIGLGPEVSLVLVMLAELFAAFFVVIGLGTRAMAAPIVFTMIVAVFSAHADDPWTTATANQQRAAVLKEYNEEITSELDAVEQHIAGGSEAPTRDDALNSIGTVRDKVNTGFSARAGSKQLAMLYLIGFLPLIFTGAGKLSIDGLIWPRVKEYRRRRKQQKK